MQLTDSRSFDLAHRYDGVAVEDSPVCRSTILTALAERAHTLTNKPFVTAVSPQNDITTLSYGALEECSRRFRTWFARELGVRPGDVVALIPANEIASILAIFGLIRSGCPIQFLSPASPVARLREQIKALGATAVLRAPMISDDFFPEAVQCPGISTLAGESEPGPDLELDASGDAFFFETSGSTATSKLVAQSHFNAAANAEAIRRHHGLRPGDRFLGCLPIHHVNGLHFTIFGTLAAGAHAILAYAFDPFHYPKLIELHRPKVASVVPCILEALLETWRAPALPNEFSHFVSAAAPLARCTAQAVTRKLGARVLQGYGLTETTNFSSTLPADLSDEAYRRLMLDADIPSIGIAMYGNEMTVLRNDGTPALVGEVGEVCMRGYNVMLRYAGHDDYTAEAFRGGWFHSQDQGFFIEDTECGRNFFSLTGRIKNIAKVRGEALSLEEMERALRAFPDVQDAACVALPHRFLGDEVIAVVVVGPSVSDANLREHLGLTFAQTLLPSRIVRVDAIPRTTTGKIQRGVLAGNLTSTEWKVSDESATREI